MVFPRKPERRDGEILGVYSFHVGGLHSQHKVFSISKVICSSSYLYVLRTAIGNKVGAKALGLINTIKDLLHVLCLLLCLKSKHLFDAL